MQLLVLLLLLEVQGFGQGHLSNYSLVRYDTENGLPQNSINAIQFDRAGYCWLATEMGLVRFDGKSFREFSDLFPAGSGPFRIRRIVPDTSGDLYVALSESQQGARMLIKTHEKGRGSYPVLLPDSTVYIPVMGYLSRGTLIRGLEIQYRKRNKTPHLISALVSPSGHSYLAYQEQLYFVKNREVVLLSGDQRRFKNGNNSVLVDDFFLHIKTNNELSVWLNGVFQPQMHTMSGPLTSHRSYLEGQFKTFWCVGGTYIYCDEALYRIYLQGGKILSEKVLDKLVVPNMISMFYAKKQNKYYIGSQTHGLYVVEPSSFQYPEVPDGALSQIFYPQSMGPKGDIFSNDILFRKDGKSVYLPLKSKDGMASYISPTHQLFYETDFILSRYDLRTGQQRSLLKLEGRLRALIPKGENVVFFNQQAVGLINGDSARIINKLPEGIKITSVIPVKEDQYLLATETGLKWYNVKQNKVYHSILDSLHIRTASLDSNGRIWVGSYGRGFYLYEGGKTYKMPHGPKDALKTVHAFIDDGRGYFWLPTNNGLFKVRKDQLVQYAYGKRDNVYYYLFDMKNGLRTNEFNGGCQPSFVRRPDGMLSISSMNGLVWFDPARIFSLYPESKIFIDQVQVNDRRVDFEKNAISLEPDFEKLSIQLSSPYFGNKANEYLQYRIAGLKNNWEAIPADGNIQIGRTAAGEYKLMVRSLAWHEAQPANEIEFTFSITPRFYNTWWFYSAVIILVLIVSFLIMQDRLRNAEKRSEHLERLVHERTQELRISLEELAYSEDELLRNMKIKDTVISMVLHDLRSPIRFLSTVTKNLVKNHHVMSENNLSEKLDELQSGTTALNDFIHKFFEWAKGQHEDFKVNKTSFSVQSLFDDISDLYADILTIQNNHLLVYPSQFICCTDYQIMALVIRNLIDNANKNTSHGYIYLSCHSSVGGVEIHVSDTGKGLTQDQIDYFLDKEKGIGHKGIGSSLILMMLDKIEGKLAIQSTIGTGSTFCVKLPVDS